MDRMERDGQPTYFSEVSLLSIGKKRKRDDRRIQFIEGRQDGGSNHETLPFRKSKDMVRSVPLAQNEF